MNEDSVEVEVKEEAKATIENENKFVYSDVESTSDEEQMIEIVEPPLEMDKKGKITDPKDNKSKLRRNEKNAL